ncbi:MAG: SURF1 family protein [Tepidimonas sp.]|uniref:SURF1 family protein n=1 Tax=Tepidimonas sp. TaxID=2002775 RepID=UPI00259EEDD1|nr:SURF1 family protein [Tepidimonas sp.]MDM7457322.1 SURF1 family protein [Tepidimonas sp.]
MKAPRARRFWWVTLAAALGVLLTTSLGVWQLGRAASKRAWLAQRALQAELPAADWGALRDALARNELTAWAGRAVRLQGRWMAEATVWLDNRPMEGRVGFVAVTPLLPEGEGPAVLVQRGWLARRPDDRQAIPALSTPEGPVTVEGRLAPPPSQLFQLGPDAPGPIRQNIQLDEFATEWRLALLPVSVQQTAPPETATDGRPLQRAWATVAVEPAKHVGYAVQWFGLAALIFALYVWFQFLSPRRRAC